MNATSANHSLQKPRALAGVLWGGAIAGAFDLTYATVFYGLRGVKPIRVSQSIASGLLGPKAYEGGFVISYRGSDGVLSAEPQTHVPDADACPLGTALWRRDLFLHAFCGAAAGGESKIQNHGTFDPYGLRLRDSHDSDWACHRTNGTPIFQVAVRSQF